jgi:hypothetical protein
MRIRPWYLALPLVALLATACSPGDFGSKADDNESSAATSIIQEHVTWKTDETIKPTAIVLHWWAAYNGGDDAIESLINGAKGNESTYNPKLKSTDKHPVVGHVTVQVAVTAKAKAYQLTPELNSFARHAKCANPWAIGIEIEGFGPGEKHDINKNTPQFDTVVAVVKELMAKYNIKAESVVADDGRSGRGIVSHKMVDAKCKWADNVYAGSGKTDVDDAYLKRVLAAVK